MIDSCIEILKYKKQIILQGPSGTGKTRLAKLIAQELTRTKKHTIDELISKFNVEDPQHLKKRVEIANLLHNFQQQHPIESLCNLSLEQYCLGTGNKTNFCWWIEVGLSMLGKYNPGTATNYYIYKSKKLNDYVKSSFLKDYTDNDEAMQQLSLIIYNLVKTKDAKTASKFLGQSLIIKILNSYYPEEYFPINSINAINNALDLFQVNTNELDIFDKNKKLVEIYNEKAKLVKPTLSIFEFADILWDNYKLNDNSDNSPITTTETIYNYEIVQFHPSYTYEDFVRGIVAEIENGQVVYKVQNKILANIAEKAKLHKNINYVLIIDEINRANLPSVLGELIYALEYRDGDRENDCQVTSMYDLNQGTDSALEDRKIVLPSNLFIIGTMNTADRSVSHIDYAIRRRFAFINVPVNREVIKYDKALALFDKINGLFSAENLSPEFNKEDVMLGHSYFIVEQENELAFKLRYEILPILKEYLKDGIFTNNAKNFIDNLA